MSGNSADTPANQLRIKVIIKEIWLTFTSSRPNRLGGRFTMQIGDSVYHNVRVAETSNLNPRHVVLTFRKTPWPLDSDIPRCLETGVVFQDEDDSLLYQFESWSSCWEAWVDRPSANCDSSEGVLCTEWIPREISTVIARSSNGRSYDLEGDEQVIQKLAQIVEIGSDVWLEVTDHLVPGD